MSSSAGCLGKIRHHQFQDDALAASDGREFYGYWMGPGTGKTRVSLKDAWRAYSCGLIDAVVVLAPNSVKTGWVAWPHLLEEGEEDQVTTHLGDHQAQIIKGVWISNASGANKKAWSEFEDRINTRHHKLIIMVANYEALLTSQFYDFLTAFCKEYRVMIIADESTRLGKPGSKRTKRATKLARLCAMRRALSGTPIVKSPMKIYSQAKFLDPNALNYNSFYAFRNRYAIMGGFQGKQILSYQNLDELSDKMAAFAFRCRKEDCLDLPPQIYLKRRVELTEEQRRAYKEMREEFYTEIKGEEVTATIVLAQITRLQQICGGYVKKDEKVIEIIPPTRNPKLVEAYKLIEDAPGQVIVWFRFRPEIEGMKALLKPSDYYEFHGGVSESERLHVRKAFKRGERAIILGTESTGGIGIDEFKVADTVIHVSCDFDTEKRIQADDRNHRMGSEMHAKITYYDIIVPGTVEAKIHRVLRNDTKLSAKILREQWREWI